MKHIRDDKAIKLFGKRVRALRKKQGISQDQLAYEAKIPRMQIGRIERAEINTSLSTIVAIANALDIHVKELFDF